MKDDELNDLYVKYIRNLIAKGFIEESLFPDMDGYFLPHHPVKKMTSKTTKVRPVFNASCKSETGISLNDCLCVGPRVQPESFDILIRFRESKFVCKSDIEMMYLQFSCIQNNENIKNLVARKS